MLNVSAEGLPGLPPDLISALVSQFKGTGRLAVVGGVVRDALLYHLHQAPLKELHDLDLVLEGSCGDFACDLQKAFGLERVTDLGLHEQFGTAELAMDGLLIDLAQARTETYPAPGQNPVVQFGSLERDLARRDFTVNAMAMVLQSDGSQLLLDPHDGQKHLAMRQLAFLHEGSVADDPTRVFRGARYCARLGFRFTPEALRQLQDTLRAWPWAWRSGEPVDAVPPALGTRLRMELELLLDREPWSEALSLLQEWSALPLLDAGLQSEVNLIRRLRWAHRLGIPLLAALVSAASDPRELALRLQIPHQQQLWMEEIIAFRRWQALEVQPRTWAEWGALEWTRRLEQNRWSEHAVALAVCEMLPCWRPLLRWWGRWRHVSSPITAQELIAQGMRPGLELGQTLRSLREQSLAQMR